MLIALVGYYYVLTRTFFFFPEKKGKEWKIIFDFLHVICGKEFGWEEREKERGKNF